MADLGDAPTPGSLEAALGLAVGDPELRMAYWLPDSGRYVDPRGSPVAEPVTAPGRAVTALVRDGRLVAVVTHAASVSDLEREIGADVRLALENERLQAEDVPEEQMSIQRLIDMRYLGQWRSLTISVEAPVDLEAAVARFHAEHQREYNYSREGAPVEIYRLNVRAVGVTPKPNLKARGSNGSATPGPQGTRLVHFDELDEPVETPVYLRADLQVGTGLTGPAIIEQLDSTTVVPPGWRAEVDEWLNIRMQDEEPTA